MESPIKDWIDIIFSDNISDKETKERLREIYKYSKPQFAELLINSYCPNKCRHCIYPSDYHKYNKNLPVENWKTIVDKLHDEWGIKKFIMDGRGFSKEICQVANYVKNYIRDSEVGIIIDGDSSYPLHDQLFSTYFDWVDISLDGDETDHDNQRNSKGSFIRTIEIIEGLFKASNFKKLSILSCLTSINKDSIINMVSKLNKEGVKNFFISSLGTAMVRGKWHPDVGLNLKVDEFRSFTKELENESGKLKDSLVELSIYDSKYAFYVWDRIEEGLNAAEESGVSMKKESNDNVFFISYYPLSLTNTREVIVNSDGRLTAPTSMVFGDIPENLIFGALKGEGIFDIFKIYEKKAFTFIENCLFEEKKVLGDLKNKSVT